MSVARTLAVLVVSASTVSTAHAYDRRYLPEQAAVAQADAIVLVRGVRMPEVSAVMAGGATADVEVLRGYKGDLHSGPLTVALDEMHLHAVGMLEPQRSYLLFLSAPKDGLREVLLDGSGKHDRQRIPGIQRAVQALPEWSGPQHGLSSIAVPTLFRATKHDVIDLWIGYRNVTEKPIELKYRSWPRKKATSWSLEVRRGEGEAVAPKPHPHITQQDIEDYFPKHGPKFDMELAPGEVYFFPVQRINSAMPGWGYKERLDFAYYPMEEGVHTIVARGKNLLGGGEMVTTNPVVVRVDDEFGVVERGKLTLKWRVRGGGAHGVGEAYRMLRKDSEKILECFERGAIYQPGLTGKMTWLWDTRRKRSPFVPRLETDTMKEPKVSSCLLGLSREWKLTLAKEGEVRYQAVLLFASVGS